MNRLLIVQGAKVGIDLDKDVEEAIGGEVYSRLLLGDLTRRDQGGRFTKLNRPEDRAITR